jgi:serine/threonine protein phosphatase PrpC
MRVQSSAATHSGLKRTSNEDAFLADDSRGIYAVADGLGGHAAGEVASATAIGCLQSWSRTPHVIDQRFFENAFAEAHRYILDDARRQPTLYGMGTTLTAAVLVGDTLHVGHAGDSACFLLRADWAKQVTDKHGSHHRLFNCLGARIDAFSGAQYVPVKVVPGDVIVLATDGLTDYLQSDQDLASLARCAASFDQLPGALVRHALVGGGHDNVTVVAVRVCP